jgi:hypothetical protein
MNAEFHAAQGGLVLPPEVTWPAAAQRMGSTDQYSAGYGVSQAQHFWYCAWAKRWLAVHSGSPAAATAAVAQLESVKQKHLYRDSYAPEVQKETDDEIAAARRGDAAPLTASVTQNC